LSDDLECRAATAADLPAIIELLHESMGRADDSRFDELFRWKHLENAFGPSPMWVACADERIVGLRTFMRWEFARAGETVRCVRAVDTATHPDFQGQGIFRRLTLDALPSLTNDGVAFVFNTPNSQSRPGYLKMGWHEIGRAQACVRPLSLRGTALLVRNRVPASHWSEQSELGRPVGEVFADPHFAALIAGRPADGRLRTRRDAAFFEWRYGTALLGYRAIAAGAGIDDGVAFIRVRRRGRAVEVVLADLLVPESAPAARKGLVKRLVKAVLRTIRPAADYALGVGSIPGCLRVPTFGPVMTTRDLAETAPRTVGAFDLALGDVELF
jgi:predicted N-acetyltransferase YhbS